MMCNRPKIQFVSGGVLSPQDSLFAVSAVVPSKTLIVCENDNVAASAFPLGGWETHTRGIGSRLLLKMGYDGQSGLGRSGEGRVLPASLSLKEFQIVPRKWDKRPTLDRILSSQKDKTVLHKQVIENKIVRCPKDKTKGNVFSFLNSVLQSSGGAEEATHKATGDSLRLDVSSSYSATNLETHLRVRIFYLHKEIGDVLRQIDQVQKSADRNEGRDHPVVKQAKRRLGVLQVKLAKLHESKRACNASIRKRVSEKKLRFF
ncbi:G-patch domain protein [Paragonimus heterotremus]|uniref:G-patch domain protein n=1 Tax=Paragonimus heterotremus TaxID=100268 RepID=A0A8J4SJK3_9TREM|nr:G-patch domain protein [Paragonimus heterotremus]